MTKLREKYIPVKDQRIWTEVDNLKLFRLKYVKVSKDGYLLPEDSNTYSVNIVGRDVDTCGRYIADRLGVNIRIIEHGNGTDIHAIAEDDIRRLERQLQEKFEMEKAMLEKRLDVAKAIRKTKKEKEEYVKAQFKFAR